MSRLMIIGTLLFSTWAYAEPLAGTIDEPALRRKIDLVYVESVPWKSEPLKESPVVNQRNNVYLPHLLVVVQGQKVIFQSEDPELHNVYARGAKRMVFNDAILPKMKTEKVFTDLGPVHLTCNIHKEMSAWVVVLQNPYWTKPEKSGAFKIDGLKPGTYTVRIWGEALSEEQNGKKFVFTVGPATGEPLRIVSR
jgi:plastocyanin